MSHGGVGSSIESPRSFWAHKLCFSLFAFYSQLPSGILFSTVFGEGFSCKRNSKKEGLFVPWPSTGDLSSDQKTSGTLKEQHAPRTVGTRLGQTIWPEALEAFEAKTKVGGWPLFLSWCTPLLAVGENQKECHDFGAPSKTKTHPNETQKRSPPEGDCDPQNVGSALNCMGIRQRSHGLNHFMKWPAFFFTRFLRKALP